MGKRTIEEWFSLTSEGRNGWTQFYKELMGLPISDIDRFMKAVNDFGHGIMFESVLAASTRKFTSDPLGYVLGIAIGKTNQLIGEISEDARYKMQLEKAKQRSMLQNEELEAKLEKARKLHVKDSEQEER